MTLRCIAPYKADQVAFEVGQVLNLGEKEERRLLADSPGSFEVVGVEPVAKAEDAPPVNKAVLEPETKKAVRRGK